MSHPPHLASTRAVYDHSADDYVAAVGTEISAKFEASVDRCVLAAFAEITSATGPGTVLDVGCGPGRVAAYLSARGLNARGSDLSVRMIEAARVAHPHLQFDEGSLNSVPLADDSLIGAVYWYSIIATPPRELPAVWEELDRVLQTGGHVLVAFQAGDGEATERPNAYGSGVLLTLYQHSIGTVADSLRTAGFTIQTEVLRQPILPHETTPQAFLLLTKTRPEASG